MGRKKESEKSRAFTELSYLVDKHKSLDPLRIKREKERITPLLKTPKAVLIALKELRKRQLLFPGIKMPHPVAVAIYDAAKRLSERKTWPFEMDREDYNLQVQRTIDSIHDFSRRVPESFPGEYSELNTRKKNNYGRTEFASRG